MMSMHQMHWTNAKILERISGLSDTCDLYLLIQSSFSQLDVSLGICI